MKHLITFLFATLLYSQSYATIITEYTFGYNQGANTIGADSWVGSKVSIDDTTRLGSFSVWLGGSWHGSFVDDFSGNLNWMFWQYDSGLDRIIKPVIDIYSGTLTIGDLLLGTDRTASTGYTTTEVMFDLDLLLEAGEYYFALNAGDVGLDDVGWQRAEWHINGNRISYDGGITYSSSNGLSNVLQISALSVPEPPALALFALGLLSLITSIRKTF